MHAPNQQVYPLLDSVTACSTDYHKPSSIDSPKWGQHDQHNSALVVNTASTRKYAAKSSVRHVRLPAFACFYL